ncbi:hypothetical protein TNIN_144531 [Trichonephila inaurata madagascariensis]|uniref:Uncharacterized protein n=1 Tax=Trichonephila inaurata madagascariensis TaxID=2747483 RepID=A0A8X7CFD2_9ARAC|nr:hypothetical protein TNIN_144531 [Trichonephila inaurata madagascariensis]
MHLAYRATKLRKFTKTDILTEVFHSTKCLHVCIVICVNMVHCSAICLLQEKTTDADCQRQKKRVIQSFEEYQHTKYCSAASDLSVSSVADSAQLLCASLPSAKGAVTAA